MAKRNPARGIRFHGATYELNFQKDGFRQFINLETSDFATAVARAEKVRKDPTLAPPAKLRSEIDRFIAYMLRMGEYTAHTARTKKNKLLLLEAFLPEGITAANVTVSQIQNWHDSLLLPKEGKDKAVTSATIHGYMMAARAFFRWAVEVAKIRRSQPLDDVKIIELKGRARESFCSYDQRDLLIRECEDEELKFILYCGFHVGLRFNEIVEAIPLWFDLEHRRVMLRKTEGIDFKDSEERTIPMTIEFHRFLKKYPMDGRYMIAPEAEKGKWLYRYDFRTKFTNYMESKGFDWVTPHIMRHTFASLLVSAGESIYKVAVWLGDNVETVQRHYGHLAPDEGGIEKAFSQRHKSNPKKKVKPKPRS